MIKTFCAATLGCVTSNVIQRGTSGSKGAVDFADLALGGLQCGVDFIAYPVALNLIGKASESFKKNMEDPNGKKYITYIAGGAVTAVIGTLAKYPIQIMKDRRKGENVKCNAKDFLKNVAGSVGGSIGFAATIGTVAPFFPKPASPLMEWAQGHVLVHIANLGATLASFPVAHLQSGVRLCDMLAGWKCGILPTMYTNDACAHFKALMQ